MNTNYPSQPPVAYNIKDFCRAMGFGRSKVYEMIKGNELKAVKVAGRTLIPASEAHRLIREAI